MDWPTDLEEIFARIETLKFPQGSHLRSTILPRKIVWELTGNSDWFVQQDVFRSALTDLKAAGLKGGRLAIFPFEVTRDGSTYNWEPMDTAIDLMHEHGMTVDLCIGPLDYPYYPGIRLPSDLEHVLQQEATQNGADHIVISQEADVNFPESSVAIRDFAHAFVAAQIDRYGTDPRIDKLYVGNEWPDTHAIENVSGVTMCIEEDLMLEILKDLMNGTDKRIALNTNIHPSEPNKMETVLGPLFNVLKERGVLGLDTYPTREEESFHLRPTMSRYKQMVDTLRGIFPQSEIVFTEYQAEPWPIEMQGQAWVDIYADNPELFTRFYQKQFPPTLESHVIASGIREVGLWGAPAWPVLKREGYTFPTQMMATIAKKMERA